MSHKPLFILIDASNIRAGGGVTHLAEILSAYSPINGAVRIEVFGCSETIKHLPDRQWLVKHTPAILNAGSFLRFWWRQRQLTQIAERHADILLIPGGSYTGSFRPYVAMAQNLLPFDEYERRREGLTPKGIRLHLLNFIQKRTFRHASGMIYMTGISQAHIERSMGFTAQHNRVIYHGTNPRFFRPLKPVLPQSAYTPTNPFRLLYVSILEPYKHQNVVVDAVGSLLQKGVPAALDLVGPGSPADHKIINKQMRRWDPGQGFMRYRGTIPYAELNGVYEKADAFIFGSSCETFGIILLEAMAGGLPIICSHRSAMPEVVGSAAIYFDPLNVDSLAAAINRVLAEAGLRRTMAFQSQQQARLFSWEKCAQETFGFLREVFENHKGASKELS